MFVQKRRQNLIEMDNRLLLDRLAIALSIKNIDNEPVKSKHLLWNPPVDVILCSDTFVSLGENARKKELLKIQMDNKRLLERIQTTVPAYNHIEWERDAHHRAAYLKNMTNFPQYFRPPDAAADERRRTKPSPDDEIFNPEPPAPLIYKDFDCTKAHEDRRTIRPNSSSYLEPINQSRGSRQSKGF